MKYAHFLFAVVLAVRMASAGEVQTASPPSPIVVSPSGETPGHFSQVKIDEALAAIEKSPADPGSRARLALAYVKLVGETGDTSRLKDGREASDKAIDLAPQDFESRRTQIVVLLAQHEFSRRWHLCSR